MHNQNLQSQRSKPALHISHRRTPSEITPLMLEQYALQQQIEMLQQQQALLQQQQQQQQQLGQSGVTSMTNQSLAYGQYPPPPPQQQLDINRSLSGGHRRNQSSNLPSNSIGTSNSHVFDTFPGQINPQAPSTSPRRQGSGHARRHSLALPEAKRAAAARQTLQSQPQQQSNPAVEGAGLQVQPRTFQFPPPQSQTPSQYDNSPNYARGGHARAQSMASPSARGISPTRSPYHFPPIPQGASTQTDMSSPSRHQRGSSRSIDQNWRTPAEPNPQQGYGGFIPGHRSRMSVGGTGASSVSSIAAFGLPQQSASLAQQNLMGAGQTLSPQLLQQQQLALQNSQRKSLFAPYLPQATLPALLGDGRLVSGFLRVNKKNRSDAYVTTDLLESDIFICGSKDRNRALEGDFVAIELLDVDEVWAQKKEKEDKKKRKDDNGQSNATGGLRRQGSIRNRPDMKKKDDIEVEGQSLLLSLDEDEVSDEQKPMYAGHVVAVVERVAGQLFSGTLGLLRPSSAATKEKQEAERREKDKPLEQGRSRHTAQQDRPKIVWFKPTDKRVPLIAIPTEQAPRDFVENHQSYANRIFVASIKRWPITSLHPFGTLVEELGNMGSLDVETEALLRDNNFVNEKFNESIVSTIPTLNLEDELTRRRDLRDEIIFTIDQSNAEDLDDAIHVRSLTSTTLELGVHIADVSAFVRAGSQLDREARKRGTTVKLIQKSVPMLPEILSKDICSLLPLKDRLAFSVIFEYDTTTGILEERWCGRSIVQSKAKLSYEEAQAIIDDESGTSETSNLPSVIGEGIKLLNTVTQNLRQQRIERGSLILDTSPLKLKFKLDEQLQPISYGFDVSLGATQLIEELMLATNCMIAQKLYAYGPDSAFLRCQAPPLERRLLAFQQRKIWGSRDISSGESLGLQSALSATDDNVVKSALETLLLKVMQPANYVVSNNLPERLSHYALNVHLYTHFTAPIQRYADIVAQRQFQAVVASDVSGLEDVGSMIKIADHCNSRSLAGNNANEQSVHMFLCQYIHNLTEKSGFVARLALVINVQGSSFDVFIPDFGIEKRLHLDQLPLKKAEFNESKRILELFWESGSSTLQEETQSLGHWRSSSGAQTDIDLQVASLSLDDNTALFDTNGNTSPRIRSTGPGEADTLSAQQHSTSANSRNISLHSDTPSLIRGVDPTYTFSGLREEAGDRIQEITELTKLPVVLLSDLSKSPYVITVKPLNPWNKGT